MPIYWVKRERPDNEYYSGRIAATSFCPPKSMPVFRSIGWAIRTKKCLDGIYYLVPTGKGVTQIKLGHTGHELGPFDSFEAAAACAKTLVGT